jgi:uncharacterized protein (TIGR04255 family)
MKISFEKPPLVEIVAELRWGLPAPVLEPGVSMNVTAAILSPSEEDFFARFSTEVSSKGFGMAERLVPQGFPSIPFQPVYRFRKSLPNAGTPTYQIGTNTFSVHITPPYRSWDEFELALSYGVELLLRTRSTEQHSVAFSSASVRYINAFDSDLTGNKTTSEFISEVLGIDISLPDALTKILKPGSVIEPNMRLLCSTDNGYQLVLSILKGLINQQKAVIMDTTAWTSDPIPPDRDVAVKVLNEAHQILHESFIEMTAKIHDIMKRKDLSA